jgi:amino acid adenylation domain-containing protein
MGESLEPVPTLERCVHALIESQVKKSSNEVAVLFGTESISYGELDSRANTLAQMLTNRGVGPDDLVAVHLDRSIEMVAALLGILKAGGAYVYLDPNYPSERREFILSDAAPVAILSRKELSGSLPPAAASRTICIDEKLPQATEPNGQPNGQRNGQPNGQTGRRRVGPANLAYLIYTSGSTGTPKAVAMPHGVLCNLLDWQLEDWTPPAPARTLQFSSLNFDVSFQEIFSTLYAGGTLILVSEVERRDPQIVLRLMREKAVERIFMPFVGLQQLATAFEADRIPLQDLRDVITAGEQLQITQQVRTFFEFAKSCTLHNQYGPAESHVVTAHALRGDPGSWPLLPPIGRPVAKARIHILDTELRPVTNGSTGEIYIGGDALARGYWNREELTAERFIPDHLSGEPNARLYRTGDLGCWLHTGGIQYLGRGDQQVKIRGVRVEPGEVEAAMVLHPAVSQAAVCAVEQGIGDKRLVSFFVERGTERVTQDQLRKFLEKKLPPQFVPSSFVSVDAMPLTASGKIDRLSLLAAHAGELEALSPSDDASARGADEVEAKLVEIWEGVLKKRPIVLGDNFFDLGGDSLLAVHVCSKVRTILGKNVSVSSLCSAPTISEFARVIHAGPRRPPTTLPPFFCVPSLVNVARHMGSDQPFYGLQFPPDSVLASPDTTTEGIADDCIRQIFEIQNSGPYYIGGYSYGGVVAFEIARQLTEMHNQQVALVAMLDPDPPKPYLTNAAAAQFQRYRFHLGNLARLKFAGKIKYLAGSLRKEAMRRFPKMFREDEPLLQTETFIRLTEAVHAKYKAGTYRGSITVILARDTQWRQNSSDDPRWAWKNHVTGHVEVYEVPGNHGEFYEEPYVREVAETLASCLAAAAAPAASNG